MRRKRFKSEPGTFAEKLARLTQPERDKLEKYLRSAFQKFSPTQDWEATVAFHRRMKASAGDQRKAAVIKRLAGKSLSDAQDIGVLILPRKKGGISGTKIPVRVFIEMDRLTKDGMRPTPAARRALHDAGKPTEKIHVEYAVKLWRKWKSGI